MKIKQMTKIHNLKKEMECECPGCSYISRTTTHRAKKGRFLGFDLGDGLQVGVFSPANSNIANITIKGYDENRMDEINIVVKKLKGLGFNQF